MAELAENQLAGAGCCAVVGEIAHAGSFVAAVLTYLRGVEMGIMVLALRSCVAVEGVVWTVPVVLP